MSLNEQERETYNTLMDFKSNHSTTMEDYRLSVSRLASMGISMAENYNNYFSVDPSVFVELKKDDDNNEYLDVINVDNETVLSTGDLDELHAFIAREYPGHIIEVTGKRMFEMFNSKSLLHDLDRTRNNHRSDLHKQVESMLAYLLFKDGKRNTEEDAFDFVTDFFRAIDANPNWPSVYAIPCPAGYEGTTAFVDIPVLSQALPAYGSKEQPEYHRIYGSTVGNAYWEAAQYAVQHYTVEGEPTA